ncbi:MAG: hypothetical protein KTR27_09340 [Leptolyngbyaceae cyanobacterium MAG.088]|nr:hypothetical protein [Leptolyngbyaceae cyanobacterium MAG.088]
MRTFVQYARQIGVASLLGTGLLAIFNPVAEAACLSGRCSQNGLIFSEASGDFAITNVTGRGTAANPFVVYQDVWGLDISLAISRLPSTPQHSVFNRPGFAISIVSRNLTGAFWRFYDHELQETAGYASSENDGLSFAQAIGPARPYTSSHYDRADEITDVRDFINFHRGRGVNAGETVRFNYFITDTIPTQKFFVRQRPDYRTNTSPTPAVAPSPPVDQPTPSASLIKPSQPEPPTVVVSQPSPQLPVPVIPQPIPQPPVPAVVVAQSVPQIRQEPVLPQPISEPSTAMMGLLAIFVGRVVKRH